MTIKIAPSILSADFARLGDELDEIAADADLVHIDIMDGHFVPNITLGAPVVKALRERSSLTFDCHLMISEPQRYIEAFIDAGANMISIHMETEPHLHRALAMIRAGGAKAGVALNPATSFQLLSDAIEYCDYVLVMSVNPGFGGQKFIGPVIEKVRLVAELIASRRLPVTIEVDGGVDLTTIADVAGAGAEILVAGSAVFGKSNRGEAIRALRRAATTKLA